MGSLEDAVAAWVRAEYHFRLGPNAYNSQETQWYVRSEKALRRALTGKGELSAAFIELKGKAMPDRGTRKRRK